MHLHLVKHAIPLMLAALILGILFGSNLTDKGEREERRLYDPAPLMSKEQKTSAVALDSSTVRINLPAVSNENNTGVTAFLQARAVNGTGKVFVNLQNILLESDTQQSARIAILVASNYTRKSTDTIDLYYDLTADATILEGPSAGAAFTVATIALLQNKQVRPDVMLTGTINHDGTVGPAGKILEKAKAAKDKNASVFLVPFGSSTELNYTESEFCYTWGSREFCTMELHIKRENISEQANIPVIEVQTIAEAAKHFLQ